MLLRTYHPTDCAELAQLFYDTVHTVNAKDYSPAQLDAWATETIDLDSWNRSFLSHDTLVAIVAGQIVGFGDMDTTGYLDRLYVHRMYQRVGIASAIVDRLECHALAQSVSHYFTHASITARPFFAHRGYAVVQEQAVERNGVLLTNFRMEKHILLRE